MLSYLSADDLSSGVQRWTVSVDAGDGATVLSIALPSEAPDPGTVRYRLVRPSGADVAVYVLPSGALASELLTGDGPAGATRCLVLACRPGTTDPAPVDLVPTATAYALPTDPATVPPAVRWLAFDHDRYARADGWRTHAVATAAGLVSVPVPSTWARRGGDPDGPAWGRLVPLDGQAAPTDTRWLATGLTPTTAGMARCRLALTATLAAGWWGVRLDGGPDGNADDDGVFARFYLE